LFLQHAADARQLLKRQHVFFFQFNKLAGNYSQKDRKEVVYRRTEQSIKTLYHTLRDFILFTT